MTIDLRMPASSDHLYAKPVIEAGQEINAQDDHILRNNLFAFGELFMVLSGFLAGADPMRMNAESRVNATLT
jgi:hypothetical protein